MGLSLTKFLEGKTDGLTLGNAPESVRSKLKKLHALGFLTEQFIWRLLDQTPVDPAYLIHFIRKYKKELNIHHEEHLVDDSIIFQYGEKTKLGYEAGLDINVFTNDITVLLYYPEQESYLTYDNVRLDTLWSMLPEDLPAGPERAEKILSILKNILSGVHNAYEFNKRHQQRLSQLAANNSEETVKTQP